MGEGNAAIQSGGKAACSEGWGQCGDSYCWLCNHSKYGIQICYGFYTIQDHLIFKTGDGWFAIHSDLLFLKTLIALKVKCF
jgi:hypothetical protein